MDVKCSTYIDAARLLLDKLKGRKVSLDTNHIIVVPDKFTLSAERFFMDGLNEDGSFDISVMTLDRIMHQISPPGKYISTQSAAMAIGRIAKECLEEGKLKCFRGTMLKGTFAAEMHKTITQLKSCRIGRQDGQTADKSAAVVDRSAVSLAVDKSAGLGAAAGRVAAVDKSAVVDGSTGLGVAVVDGVAVGSAADSESTAEGVPFTKGEGDPRIMRKLHDINLLYRKYHEFLSDNGYKDASDRMEILIERIPNSDYIKQSYFYILGFDSVTPQAAAAIDGLKRFSKGVVNTVVSVESSAIKGGEDVFCAADYSAFSSHLREHYLKYPIETYPHKAPITVYKAYDRQDMLEAAALKIKQCLLEGFEFGDIAVIGELSFADLEVFEEAQIRYNFDHKEPLTAHPAVRLVTDIIAAVAGNYYNGLAAVAKNPLSGVDYQAAQTLENYCLKYNITYGVSRPFEWGKDTDAPTVQAAESVRRYLYGKIAAFEGEYKAAQTVEEYIAAISKLIEGWGLKEACDNYAQNCYIDYRPFAAQGYDKLMAALNDAAVLKGYRAGKQEMADILMTGLAAAEISAIPHKLNAVDVGGLGAFRFTRYRLVIYIDAAERSFPAVSKDGGLLLDSELDRMGDTGKRIIPKIRDINARQKALTVMSMLLGGELFFTYPATEGGEDVKEAFLLSRLRESFPYHEYYDYEGERAAYASNSGLWQDGYLKGVPSKKAGVRRFFSEYNRAKNSLAEVVSPPVSALNEVFLDGREPEDVKSAPLLKDSAPLFFYRDTSSVSRFESYFECPYKHYVRYGLRAKPRPDGSKTDAAKAGNILHMFLERYLARLNKIGDDGQAQREAYEIMDGLKNQPDTLEADRALIERLKPEAAAIAVELLAQSRQTDFEIFALEAEFGEGKAFDGVRLTAPGGGEIVLAGKIDRIDRLGQYVRVIDYKTGTVNKGWADVYYGKDIQLFVYMGALRQAGYRPAGILYFPISNDYQRTAKNRFKMKGYLNGDGALINAGDREIATSGESRILPVKLKRDGTPNSHTAKILLSEEEFDTALDYCRRLLSGAVKEITEGYIAPAPVQGVCRYCDYIGVCASYDKQERKLVAGADKQAVLSGRVDGFVDYGDSDE